MTQAREVVRTLLARRAELQVMDDATFDAVALQVIDEVPRWVRTSQDARRVVGKLVAAAERGSLDAAAMLLLANDLADRPRGVAAYLRSQGLRVSRPVLAGLLEERSTVTTEAA